MTASLRSRARHRVAVAASMVAVLGACSVGPGDAGLTAPTAPASATTPAATAGLRVVLRFGDERATATLAATQTAREFSAMLPLTVELSDRMGQAKSGQLPRPLDLTGADRVFDTTVGEITYWSPGDTLVVVYDGLGPTAPDPGLVRLGVITAGLDELGEAGDRTQVRIELAAEPLS